MFPPICIVGVSIFDGVPKLRRFILINKVCLDKNLLLNHSQYTKFLPLLPRTLQSPTVVPLT